MVILVRGSFVIGGDVVIMAPRSTTARTIDDRSPVSAGAQPKPTTGHHEEPVAAPPAASTGRGVLGRAFAVLEALAQADAGLGLTGLARASGLAKTSAYRLAEQRVALGAVQRVDQRYYVGAWREGVEAPNRMSTILTSRDIPGRCNLTGAGRLSVPHGSLSLVCDLGHSPGTHRSPRTAWRIWPHSDHSWNPPSAMVVSSENSCNGAVGRTDDHSRRFPNVDLQSAARLVCLT
jgi:hypothetical protein